MNASPEKTIPTAKKKLFRQFSIAALTSFTIIAITLIFAVVAVYLNHQLSRSVEKNFNFLQENLNMLIQQQSNTEARLQAYRATTQSHEARAEKAMAAFEKSMLEKLNAINHSSDDWQLLKARYLLELAQLNAQWSNDISSTQSMLVEADNLLTSMHHSDLIAVRKALALDLQTIQNKPDIDITRILTQLDSALMIASALPLISLPEKPTSIPGNQAHNTMQSFLNYLSQFIVIRYHTHGLEPQPTLAYEAILRASIKLNIQVAQWAVIARNNSIYQLALSQSLNTLSTSFLSQNPQSERLKDCLTQLQTISLTPAHLVPENALKTLNLIIEKKDNSTLRGTS